MLRGGQVATCRGVEFLDALRRELRETKHVRSVALVYGSGNEASSLDIARRIPGQHTHKVFTFLRFSPKDVARVGLWNSLSRKQIDLRIVPTIGCRRACVGTPYAETGRMTGARSGALSIVIIRRFFRRMFMIVMHFMQWRSTTAGSAHVTDGMISSGAQSQVPARTRKTTSAPSGSITRWSSCWTWPRKQWTPNVQVETGHAHARY